MYELMKKCAMGLAAAGFIALGGYSAQAQVIVDDDDDYAVETQVVDEDADDDDDGFVIMKDSGMARCAATFRSFDPSSGTYVTYGGETLPCPYLE